MKAKMNDWVSNPWPRGKTSWARCRPIALIMLLMSLPSTVFATVRYVDGSSNNPTPPYTNWANAAATIQQAVDAAVPGDEIVVTNGVYATGGRAVELITGQSRGCGQAADAARASTARSSRSSRAQGARHHQRRRRDPMRISDRRRKPDRVHVDQRALRVPGDYYSQQYESSGGGLWCESTNAVASNCVVTVNSDGYYGGGAWGGTLDSCALIGNSTGAWGGGAFYGTLNKCLLTGNSAGTPGGGANPSTRTTVP